MQPLLPHGPLLTQPLLKHKQNNRAAETHLAQDNVSTGPAPPTLRTQENEAHVCDSPARPPLPGCTKPALGSPERSRPQRLWGSAEGSAGRTACSERPAMHGQKFIHGNKATRSSASVACLCFLVAPIGSNLQPA